MEYAQHFKALFRELEEEHGRLDKAIVGAIVGFSAGGPVSLSTIKKTKIYVTCELSLHEQQKASAPRPRPHDRVGDVLEGKGPAKVRLVLFSKAEIDGQRYGVYEVVPDERDGMR